MEDRHERRELVKHPLNFILGAEAQVRLLRAVLVESDTPLTVTLAARIAGLTRAGARRALGRLVEAGIVERVGTGRSHQYRPRDGHPLIEALGGLFKRENETFETLVDSLRKICDELPEIHEAWLMEPDETSGELGIQVVVEAQAVDWIAGELRARLAGIEAILDQVIEVSVFTRADAPSQDPNAVPLLHMGPSAGKKRQVIPSHARMEERSLLMSRAIADMLRSDPTLITRARRHLDRLLQGDQGTATSAVLEWRQLLDGYSIRQLAHLLGSVSSRAKRLRQSSPFFAVLTGEERDRVIASMEQSDDAKST